MPPPADCRTGLANALRQRTRALHAQAERTGVIRALLEGRATRYGYALLLRNLLPAYQHLEQGLEAHRLTPGIGGLAHAPLYRAAALAADLGELLGHDWSDALPLLPAGERYAQAVAAAADGRGERLAAHAYVRYLGDLNGGRVLKSLLERTLGLPASALSFYAFPGLPDLDRFKADYRDALDRAGTEFADFAAVVAEAELAFRLNIDISQAVQAAAGERAGGTPAGTDIRAR
ncbi:MAG: heme oxygenase (biliverdin-producing) [Pseudomonadota bacterium]